MLIARRYGCSLAERGAGHSRSDTDAAQLTMDPVDRVVRTMTSWPQGSRARHFSDSESRSRPSTLLVSRKDRTIPLALSRARGRVSTSIREPENRESGYAPACANEWVMGTCEKPRIKCAECPNRHFLPVTDDVIRWHLSGYDDAGQRFVAGVYPMLLDETCFFLAVDFDKGGWLEDSTAYVESCRELSPSAALERSRSGLGAHVWLFFDEAVPAALARKVGSYILTETMERRPDIGFDLYDRFLPAFALH